MENFKRALWEMAKAALSYTVYCLFAMAILAAIVKAASPAQTVVTVSCWILKIIGCFVFSLIFIKRPRALFKGLAAGLAGTVLAMFAFAAVGGGFHVSLFFLLELAACALAGGAGALLGTKLRKDA